MSEQMKPSGIDWIGDIPIDWKIGKVRFVTALRGEKGFYTEKDKYIGLENISSYTGEYLSSETEYDSGIYDVYKKGDLLFNKLRPYLAKALIANDDGFCTGELEVISEYKGDKRYLFYYLLSDGFLKMVDASTYGTKMPRANWDYIKNFSIPLLPSKEQQAIADYLDKQCNKIDGIISDLETQIDTLQRYKKSLILETVTKGLNKKAPIKPSGIDWIGDVPKHWDVKPLKFLFSLYAGGDIEEYNVFEEKSEINRYPIYSNSLENNGLFGYTGKYRFSGETITITGRGEVGNAIPRYDSYYPIVRLLVGVPKQKVNVEYFSSCINSANILGEQTAMAQLTTQKLGTIKVPVPPFEEQEAIGMFLQKKTSTIDVIINDKRTQLETIKQHKKSLIYEYVTGKKRVKEKHNGN